MPNEVVTSLISSIIGGLLVAIINNLFMRERNQAEVEKLRAEAGRIRDAESEKLRAEAELMRAEASKVTSEIKNFNATIVNIKHGVISFIDLESGKRIVTRIEEFEIEGAEHGK